MRINLLSRSLVVGVAAALTLTACSGSEGGISGETRTVEDNFGTQTVPADPQRIVATDNSTYETLDSWGIPLAGASRALMPTTISYKENKDIVDLGTHREPDLEQVVAIDPDLIINGGRFAQYRDDFKKYAPNAGIIEVDPRDGEPLDAELKRGTSVLGEVFGKQDEADKLNEALDASIERVKAAYKPGTTVMGLIVSGGKIGYVTPGTGRTIGPMFDIFGFTPALKVEDGSSNHQGDDISVEAIAQSNPALIIAMDRDSATSSANEPDYVPAKDVIDRSQALQQVTAVKNGDVLYLPADTYTNESIQTYTEFFNQLADHLEKQS